MEYPKQFFFRDGVPGIYGPRVFITYDDLMWTHLTMSSKWKGYDKRETTGDIDFYGFEMPDDDTAEIAMYLLCSAGFSRIYE